MFLRIITLKITWWLKIIQGGGGGNSLINNGLDTYIHYIDDYSFLDVTEITNTPQDNEYLSSLGLSSATKSENLPKGTKYTILAYKRVEKDENEYDYILHVQQEFTVGDINPKIELNSNQNYTLFVVSTGNSTSAKIEDVNNINNVRFTPNGSNTSFLYQKIENFTPSGDKNNVLDIKLKGSAKVSVILDVSELLPDSNVSITSISNVRLTYKRFKGVKLNSTTGNYDSEEVTLLIKSTSFLNNKRQYKVDFYDTFMVDNNSDFKFHADVTAVGFVSTGGSSGYILPLVKSGYRYTFVLKPMVCGGYLGANKTNFRVFMCHNLGDGYSGKIWTDKFSGNRYAWGRKAVVYEQRGNPYDEGNIWKESENPCPVGYRVPTIDEWQLLLDERNNARERLYDDRYKRAGWKIGERLALFTQDDHRKFIWSTTMMMDRDSAYSVNVTKNYINGSFKSNKYYGQAVRCIRK